MGASLHANRCSTGLQTEDAVLHTLTCLPKRYAKISKPNAFLKIILWRLRKAKQSKYHLRSAIRKKKVCCSYKWLVRAVWQQGSLQLIKLLVATSRNCYKGFWQRGWDGMIKVFAQLRKKKGNNNV